MHIKSIDIIKKTVERHSVEKPIWLKYLEDAEEIHQNYEYVNSVQDLSKEGVLSYVLRTLEVLETLNLKTEESDLLEMVLVFSELAKSGNMKQRKLWLKKGYNLMVHNEGSAKIFDELVIIDDPRKKAIIRELINTHGLVGQFIRGESRLRNHQHLVELMREIYLDEQIFEILYHLNHCIIGAVSNDLWRRVEIQVKEVICNILDEKFDQKFYERIHRLTSKQKETIAEKIAIMNSTPNRVESLLSTKDLWYFEPALHDFNFEDIWTILLIIGESMIDTPVEHIHFEKLMQQMYYDFKGAKHCNVYRKRVIEKFLKEYRETNEPDESHVSFKVDVDKDFKTAHVYFKFSGVGEALINFCIEAEKTDMLHNKATVMLFDFFGLRRDAYDRFHNEDTYLAHMNSAADDKKIILDFIKGDTVLDVGPGGGVMLDMIEDNTENKTIIGIDISENVIESLKKKKNQENRQWSVIKGDALNLMETFEKGSLDTIIYSSIIHELFSYIPWEGKKFNHEVVKVALKSAYEALRLGGRIIIRDGIMTEDKDEKRIIRFKEKDGMSFLKQYAREFKGRTIKYTILSDNEVTMPINDAMEFLYTYTWGPDSFPHEVQEQFGVFTPNEYRSFVANIFGSNLKVIHSINYLQQGYTLHLKDKIHFEDEKGMARRFPDSTFLLVLEKQ